MVLKIKLKNSIRRDLKIIVCYCYLIATHLYMLLYIYLYIKILLCDVSYRITSERFDRLTDHIPIIYLYCRDDGS